ncbi:hypothetical protein AB0F17_34260 [Nonomuraea sp. NPDC026600]|uniref:hypothetical protein n=1 Tax=Nonomuraea sp. NPDC026600 TaxID=3155363 RepID=UPI0033CEAA74
MTMTAEGAAPESEDVERIVWTPGKYDIWEGRVNGVKLFAIAPGRSRWLLVTLLPAVILEPDVHEDANELRASAERAIRAHVHALGAAFVPAVPRPRASWSRRADPAW